MFDKHTRIGRKHQDVEIGDVSRPDIVKDKLLLNKRPPREYHEIKKEEEKQVAETQVREDLELLSQVIEYGKKHGKKITFKLENDLIAFFDALNEDQLYEVQDLLDFSHDPYCPKCKKGFRDGMNKCPEHEISLDRLIITVPDHRSMVRLGLYITRRIPGYQEILKIRKISKEIAELEQVKHNLENILKEKQVEFRAIHQESGISSEFTCEFCGKDCTNKGGLGSHVKHCPKNPENIKEDINATET